jgi:hypothetical protein
MINLWAKISCNNIQKKNAIAYCIQYWLLELHCCILHTIFQKLLFACVLTLTCPNMFHHDLTSLPCHRGSNDGTRWWSGFLRLLGTFPGRILACVCKSWWVACAHVDRDAVFTPVLSGRFFAMLRERGSASVVLCFLVSFNFPLIF